MGFLAPGLLAGLVAIGLPIYLHLLRKQQEQPTPFATLMFLEKSEEQHSRQKNLRYLLLFALRALVVLLLVLAFSQPFWREPAEAIKSDRLTVVALDGSLSMTREGLPEAARAAALQVIDGKGGQAGQVLSFARGATLLTEPTGKAETLREAVQNWKPSASAGSFAELAQAVTSIAANEKKPIDLHVISDFQATAMPATFSESQLPVGTNLVEHVVGNTGDNWAIDSVVAPARVAPNEKMQVVASVASYAGSDMKIPVALYLEDRKVASKEVTVKARERATVEFKDVEPGPQWTRAQVRLELADALSADSDFRFAVEKTDLQTIAFVSATSVNLAARYMETALSAAPNNMFRFQMLAPGQLTEQNLRSFAYIVIDAAPNVVSGLGVDLSRYLRAGGSVFLLLPRSAAAGTNLAFAETTVRAASHGTDRGDLRLDAVDPGHPVLAGLDGLRAVRFLNAWDITGDGLNVLARLGDGTPILAEKRVGDGRVLVMTSTVDSASNDMPFQPVFVPFIERVSRYLSGMSSRELSRRVDEFLEVRPPGVAPTEVAGFEITGPDGNRVVSRAESVQSDGVVLDLPGFYKLERAGGRTEWIAANVSPVESDLAVMDDAQKAVWKASGEEVASAAAVGASGAQERKIPFGWYGLLILAGILLAESVVANRYWRRSAEGV